MIKFFRLKEQKSRLRGTSEVLRNERMDWGEDRCKVRKDTYIIYKKKSAADFWKSCAYQQQMCEKNSVYFQPVVMTVKSSVYPIQIVTIFFDRLQIGEIILSSPNLRRYCSTSLPSLRRVCFYVQFLVILYLIWTSEKDLSLAPN
jgi:hypothetical protein